MRRTHSLTITFSLLSGLLLAGAISVYATSLGTNLFVTGTAGIGTTSPGALLGVQGDILAAGKLTVSSLIATSTTATSTFAAPIAGATGNLTISSAGTTNNLLLNPYGGNVGVGTTSPNIQGYSGTVETISGSTGTLELAGNNTIADANIGIVSFHNTASGGGRLGAIVVNRDNANNSGYMIFNTVNAGTIGERMRIDRTGNLGLGTTTPNWLLQVAGTRPSLTLSDTSQSAASNLQHWLLSSMGGNLYIGTSTGLYATSTPAALTILNNGNLGIGTTSPWALLSVNPNGVSGPEFAVGSSTKTDLVILNNGNVGVGTTTPSSIFSIEGPSTATTTLFLGNKQSTTKGSCIQLYTTSGAAVRLYATTTGTVAIWEAGACQ